MSGKIVQTYDYIEDGQLRYQVCRTDPKGFFQRRPMPGPAGEWAHSLSAGTYRRGEGGIWSVVTDERPGDIKLEAVKPILYRLDELRNADPRQPVCVTEGEKDVEALRHLGFIATCNSGGAGKWKPEYGGYLSSRRVVIFPDDDLPGVQHAIAIVGSCFFYGAESVRVVKWGTESTGEGFDLCDWLRKKWPDYGNAGQVQVDRERMKKAMREGVAALVKRSAQWRPEAVEAQKVAA